LPPPELKVFVLPLLVLELWLEPVLELELRVPPLLLPKPELWLELPPELKL